MSSSVDWRKSVSFSRRLDNTSKLSQSFQASRDLDSSNASREATSTEQAIYQGSSTQEEYQSRCWKAIEDASLASPQSHAVEQAAQKDEASQNREVNPSPESNISHDGWMAPSAVKIGNYEKCYHHRDGIFSTIYKSSKKDFPDEWVALKVTTPATMAEPHNSAREARILNGLRHPAIIPLLETFQQPGGKCVLVLPFMPLDLRTVLEKGLVSHDNVRAHLQNLFQALEFLHANGCIHRDVKPSNILLQHPSGPAYLADFGIAWSPSDKESEPFDSKITDVGTTCYRPPELLFGNRHYNETLDLWAAGCVVAEADGLNGCNTLFDAGDLGSELALIKSIFQSLGTPNSLNWPEAVGFRDWGKMQFREFPPKSWSDLLPDASDDCRELVAQLVQFQSTVRLAAAEVRSPQVF